MVSTYTNMSMQFNDTTNYKGLVQQYELEIGGNDALGTVSGNTIALKAFTANANLALDDFTKLALAASGTWQWDDNNQSDYPIIKTNIVSGQRDYTFTTDQNNNYILEIYKVAILQSATATQYAELPSIDTQSEDVAARFNDSSNSGIPFDYDKTANAIIFGTVPNYNATSGLLIYINREASYFTSSDTTRVAGIPGIFHRYLVLKPAEDYARRNTLASHDRIQAERIRMEADIKTYFGRRERDVRKEITTRPIRHR